jgi:hypothetical protein
MKKIDVDLVALRPPASRPFVEPTKLARMGPFDMAKYQPIWVEQEGNLLTIIDGMTRVEAARLVGIVRLPAYVFTK